MFIEQSKWVTNQDQMFVIPIEVMGQSKEPNELTSYELLSKCET